MGNPMRTVKATALFALALLFGLGLTIGQGDVGFVASALADGMPAESSMGLQPSNSPVMTDIHGFYNFILAIMVAVVVLVTALLIYVMIRFNRRANPNPSRTSHNTLIEVIWTVVPVLILIVLAIPSFRLLYKQLDIPDAELTVKATGYQWYWGYEYPDNNGVSFDAYMIADNDLKEGQLRNLSVDNPLVVPVDTTIRMIVTGGDVIHSWALPVFGVKIDAIPGRLNETWFRAEKTGTYYGQCSELCGMNHAFMPIEIKVVSKDDFQSWISGKQQAQGLLPEEKVASAQAASEGKEGVVTR